MARARREGDMGVRPGVAVFEADADAEPGVRFAISLSIAAEVKNPPPPLLRHPGAGELGEHGLMSVLRTLGGRAGLCSAAQVDALRHGWAAARSPAPALSSSRPRGSFPNAAFASSLVAHRDRDRLRR